MKDASVIPGFLGHVEQMLQVTLSLPSVRLSVPQSALQSSKVDLKTLAQESVGKHFLRLVTSHGCNLNDPLETLQAAGLQDGDQVTALVGQTIDTLLHCGAAEVMGLSPGASQTL